MLPVFLDTEIIPHILTFCKNNRKNKKGLSYIQGSPFREIMRRFLPQS